MKYYIEDEMKTIREGLEKTVLNWSGISTRKMFGCPCYKANDKLFAFLVTNGIIITKLTEAERKKISNQYESKPFKAGNKTINTWIQIPVNDAEEITNLIPLVKKSYNTAIKE